ncbi:hypothetical protein PENTCL1PPCAC_3088, partial [Pristionchus entomophagus]
LLFPLLLFSVPSFSLSNDLSVFSMPIAEFIAGFISGFTGVFIGYPLDTIKTRLQTGNAYGGILDAFSGIIKKESALGLYKGMLAPVLSAGFMNSLLFTGNGIALRLLHPDELNIENRKDIPMSNIIFASCVGTAFQLVPAVPVELLKTRLQVQQNEVRLFHKSSRTLDGKRAFSGPFEMAKDILKKEGIKGLYKGGTVVCARNLIGLLFYLPVYEGLTKVLHD